MVPTFSERFRRFGIKLIERPREPGGGKLVISLIIIHVVLSGVLIGRETITSLQITAYE